MVNLSGSLITIAATKNAQNDHFHTLVDFVVIAWLLHLPARQCTSTHHLRDGWVFGSRDTWFHAPMLLEHFFISETDKVYHQSSNPG